jgi:tetratricopeptide (TPR) repeat protein/tRNA A-37 threonylcarbamoyl transferase component Bud32
MNEETLFHEALARPAAERAAFLDAACAGQPELRAAVESLLAAHEASGSLLDRPAVHPGQTVDSEPAPARPDRTGEHAALRNDASAPIPTTDSAPEFTAGPVIGGRYALQDKIGEGGMGEVWVAKQTEPVKRRVALKLIKAGMDSRAVLARFEQERQALAMMDHPNIAKVLDGGLTDDRRPFFVMELVNGLPLTRFCDQARLGIRERLELFTTICQAVQHAHQKGIVHRDLKPSNILVTLIDGRPVPKVIDFGVAKAVSGKLTDETLSTQFGAVVGTLEYMSPEQAGFSGQDIDTRADIYSLGVLLYELLTGLRPLDAKRLRKAAYEEMIRIIQEEEPSKPSTRLSTDESLPSLAALRQTEPKRLMAMLRGELDWVVMKCLEKQRDRRYETANGLARDIQRYLADEPVEARPPSAAYRMGKFLRRNKGAVLAASLVLLALVGGIAGTTYGMIRAEYRGIEADEARRREAKRAEGERQARQREAEERARAEKARDRTRQALDAMTSTLTGNSLGTQKSISEEQKKFLREVLTYYKEFAGDKTDDERARALTAQAAFRVGLIEARLGHKKEAAAAMGLASNGYEKLVADFPLIAAYRKNLAHSSHNLGLALQSLGDRAEAERHLRRTLDLSEKLAAEYLDVPEYRREQAACHNDLGILLRELGRREAAEEKMRRAMDIQEKLAADFPVVPAYRFDLARTHTNLGRLLAGQGKGAKAEREYRKALALYETLTAKFPAVPEYRRNLAIGHLNWGNLLADQGKQVKAEQRYRQAVDLCKKLAGDFPSVPEYRRELANYHTNLGLLLAGLGKREEAEQQYRQALALKQTLAAEFPTVPGYRQDQAGSHINLGNLLVELGKWVEAEQQFRLALNLFEKLAADFPNVPRHRLELSASHSNLGNILASQGKRVEAEQQIRQALAIRRKLAADFPTIPDYRRELAGTYHSLGVLLHELGKLEEAEQKVREALGLNEKLTAELPTVPGYREGQADNHSVLGAILADQGKRPEAEQQFRRAVDLFEKLTADFPAVPSYQVGLGLACANLGQLILLTGRPGDSLASFGKAIRTLRRVYDQDHRLVEVRYSLRNAYRHRATVYHLLGKYSEAARDWDKVIALSPPGEQPGFRASRASAWVHSGRVAEAVVEVAELTKTPNWNAGQWYDFACVYAVASGKIADKKQEYADRAMEMLHRAVKAGYKDAAHMARDTDLDPLRGRDDFKRLLIKQK